MKRTTLITIGLWCNSCTNDFESFRPGASPGGPTKKNYGSMSERQKKLTVNQSG